MKLKSDEVINRTSGDDIHREIGGEDVAQAIDVGFSREDGDRFVVTVEETADEFFPLRDKQPPPSG
ncbi:MAG: hypothetical protein U0903_14435 [Planctomycetales bacterium]